MRYADPRLVDHLAGAFVLGTLTGGARRRFERLRGDRADVALAVREWEARFASFSGSVPPVRPSARVWREIDARTRPPAARGFAAAGWRPFAVGLTGVLSGAALAVAILVAAPALIFSAEQVALREGGKLPPSYVGLLTDARGNGKLLVSSLRHGRTMTVKAIGTIEEPPADSRLVLWAVPSDAAPFVLGAVPIKGSLASELPDTSEHLLSKVTKLVVTVETSDTPVEPGHVLYRGNCAKLW